MDNQTKDLTKEHLFLMMTLILSEQQCHKFARIAKEKGIRGGIVVIGRGTVKNTTLNLLGIKSEKKEIINFIIEKEKAGEMLDFISNEFRLIQPGHGIAYTSPVIVADQIINNNQSDWNTVQGAEEESMYKKLTVVVNRGLAENVMDIALKSGVKGGTVLHGRGTGSEFTAKLLGMEIEPEKELVVILMPSELIEKVVNDLFVGLQLDNPGNGVLFVEPIVEVRGLFDTHLNNKNN